MYTIRYFILYSHVFCFDSNILPLLVLLKKVINANSITPVNKVINHVNSPKKS